jgi:hypothetical protein
LDIVGPQEYLKGIVKPLGLEVASAEGGQYKRIIDLGLLDVTHLRYLRGGYCQVVHSLLVRFAQQVSPPLMEVRQGKSKIGFSVGKYQNFGNGELVRSDPKCLLGAGF